MRTLISFTRSSLFAAIRIMFAVMMVAGLVLVSAAPASAKDRKPPKPHVTYEAKASDPADDEMKVAAAATDDAGNLLFRYQGITMGSGDQRLMFWDVKLPASEPMTVTVKVDGSDAVSAAFAIVDKPYPGYVVARAYSQIDQKVSWKFEFRGKVLLEQTLLTVHGPNHLGINFMDDNNCSALGWVQKDPGVVAWKDGETNPFFFGWFIGKSDFGPLSFLTGHHDIVIKSYNKSGGDEKDWTKWSEQRGELTASFESQCGGDTTQPELTTEFDCNVATAIMTNAPEAIETAQYVATINGNNIPMTAKRDGTTVTWTGALGLDNKGTATAYTFSFSVGDYKAEDKAKTLACGKTDTNPSGNIGMTCSSATAVTSNLPAVASFKAAITDKAGNVVREVELINKSSDPTNNTVVYVGKFKTLKAGGNYTIAGTVSNLSLSNSVADLKCGETDTSNPDIFISTFKTCWGTVIILDHVQDGRSPYIKTIGLTQNIAKYDMNYGDYLWVPRWVTEGGFDVEVGMVIDANPTIPGEQATVWHTTRGIPGYTLADLQACQQQSITCNMVTVKMQQPDGRYDDLKAIEQYIWGSTGRVTIFRGNIALGTDSGSFKTLPLVWGGYDDNGWPTWHTDSRDFYNGAGLYRMMGGAVAINSNSPWHEMPLVESGDFNLPVCSSSQKLPPVTICIRTPEGPKTVTFEDGKIPEGTEVLESCEKHEDVPTICVRLASGDKAIVKIDAIPDGADLGANACGALPYELPKTGGEGVNASLIAMIALILLALGMYLRRRIA